MLASAEVLAGVLIRPANAPTADAAVAENTCPARSAAPSYSIAFPAVLQEESPIRTLYTMLRVGDIRHSIDFYIRVLGMQLLHTSDNPGYKYSLAFVGYGPEASNTVIELTCSCGVDEYELDTAFGHLAIEIDDAVQACDQIHNAGGKVMREADPIKGGSTIVMFVEDPDGYKAELIQARSIPDGNRH